MARKEYRVRLRSKEREQLSDLARKGVERARVITRARILLLADESAKRPEKMDREIAQTLGVGLRTVAVAREK